MAHKNFDVNLKQVISPFNKTVKVDSDETIFRGKLNFFFGKKNAPNSDISKINFFILLFCNE